MGERLQIGSTPAPNEAGEPLTVDLVTTEEGADQARIKARLFQGAPARLLAEPEVITRWDEQARILWADPASGQRIEVRVIPHRAPAAARARLTPPQ